MLRRVTPSRAGKGPGGLGSQPSDDPRHLGQRPHDGIRVVMLAATAVNEDAVHADRPRPGDISDRVVADLHAFFGLRAEPVERVVVDRAVRFRRADAGGGDDVIEVAGDAETVAEIRQIP